jgi:DNA-binding NtrC family response regulator
MNPARVLVVEDDDAMRELLADELQAAGYEVVAAGNGAQALARLQRDPVDVVVTDLMMPGMKGNEVLERIRQWDPVMPVVIMTAFGSIESAVESMRAGAYHYVTKPFKMEELVETVGAAVLERRLRAAHERDPSDTHWTSRGIVAESPAMRRALAMIERAAVADTPVLIRGESGTGKELLARALHTTGPRSTRPFVPVNCSAIPETLLESQLFGHRRGAFTDAREDHTGLFQQADGGTIFLDDIGDMAVAVQSKLLRVLQEREIHPLGAPAPVRVDVRVVAATHRDLEAMCAAGQFRDDLYYRLNVIGVRVPPLRERPGDLVPLIAHFLEKHGARLGRRNVSVGREAIDVMRSSAWPGNVRELENVIERALVLGTSDSIGREDLPESLTTRHAGTSPDEVRALSEVERDEIVRALRSVNGNKSAAARLLGLDRKTLYRKLDLYGLKEA